MEISKIFATKTVEVEDTFNDEPYIMTVCVYPTHQTPYFAKLIRLAQEGDIDAYAEALALLIPKWNISLGDEPFPPTKENFLRVPREFCDHAFEKAWKAIEDAKPKVTIIESEKKDSEKLEIVVAEKAGEAKA